MLRVYWLSWGVNESKLTYLVIFLRQQRAKGTRVWASHLSKWCIPVYPKVSERAAKNQLPLKKKALRAFRCLQLGLSNVPAFPFGLWVFLASNWEWETGVQRFLGWEDTSTWVMGSLLLLMCIYTLWALIHPSTGTEICFLRFCF